MYSQELCEEGNMKKFKEKRKCIALAIALMMLLTCAPFEHVHAASSEQKGTLIEVNKEYKGVLETPTDVDRYTVDVTEKGYFQINLDIDDSSNGNIGDGWKITVYDNEFEKIKSFDRIRDKFTSVKLPFSVGQYYVKIEAWNTASSWAPTDSIYKLNVSNTADSSWESEYNNTRESCETVAVNSTYWGTLYAPTDVDWYTVDVTEKGYFQINLDIDDSSNGNIGDGWKITVYDNEFEKIKSFDRIRDKFTSVKLPFSVGQYYVKIEAWNTASSWAPTDSIYKLNVSNTADSSWESEYNNTFESADKMVVNSSTNYKGTLYRYSDMDYYYFNVASKGKSKIHIKLDEEKSTYGWTVKIYNSKGKVISNIKKVNTTQTKQISINKGKYYIRVEATDKSEPWAPTDYIYGLNVSFVKTPAATKITKITSKNKSAIVKWSKKSSATGYIVYRSTSKKGTYKKVATIKNKNTTSYKNKGLKKGKRYYYKVKTYRTYNGVTAYANLSSYKSIRVK